MNQNPPLQGTTDMIKQLFPINTASVTLLKFELPSRVCKQNCFILIPKSVINTLAKMVRLFISPRGHMQCITLYENGHEEVSESQSLRKL